jgi:anti-sigma regulatory factor (Ser/Thr protein kinase)
MDLTAKIRNKLAGEHLMFAYRGEVTSENSVLLLTILEKEMEFSEFSMVGRKRLFMFVLENLQNITRHADAGYEVMSMVVYTKTEDGYTVTTGNVISSDQVEGLQNSLDTINKLDPDKIREVYREMLKDSDMSSKGGAGLGLIEMARKTGNKLDYDFIPIDRNHSYFVLSKTVDSGGRGMHDEGKTEKFSGNKIAQLEHMMKANNIYFIWAGHITPDINKEVLNFNETRMLEEDLEHNLQKRVFTILIELLQNVAQHTSGFEAEQKYGMPVAMIRSLPGSYIVTSGNLIRKADVEPLKQKLNLVNNHDEEDLNQLLRTALANQNFKEVSTGYMGLLEMARRSGNKLEYSFEEVNKEYCYYVLTVKVRSKSPK